MSSIDLKKTYKEHYHATSTPVMVELPPRPYLMIDGMGNPNTSQSFSDAISTLYPLAYGLRARIKEETGTAYTVMPLEGFWWAHDMAAFRRGGDKSTWQWTLMICLPDAVVSEMVRDVFSMIMERKKLPLGHLVRVEHFKEGLAAQVLHKGPYDQEASTIETLHAFIAAKGYHLRGKHHEIYLGDPRKSSAENLRTILRQPVRA